MKAFNSSREKSGNTKQDSSQIKCLMKGMDSIRIVEWQQTLALLRPKILKSRQDADSWPTLMLLYDQSQSQQYYHKLQSPSSCWSPTLLVAYTIGLFLEGQLWTNRAQNSKLSKTCLFCIKGLRYRLISSANHYRGKLQAFFELTLQIALNQCMHWLWIHYRIKSAMIRQLLLHCPTQRCLENVFLWIFNTTAL